MPQRHDLAKDPFFRLTDDSEWNACIGPQGHEENYVDGYMEAALYLSEVVIEKELHVSRDTLVLPILYNARHAIELALKYVSKQLHDEGVLLDPPRANHKIREHLEKLVVAKFGDRQLRELLARLSPFVLSLAEIDDDGQQLRYAIDQAGQSSLEDRSLANLQVIHSSLRELSEVLKLLKRRTRAFCEEHRTGTFTAQCSRFDLMEMTRSLALVPDRRGDDYAKLRSAFKANYGLGNQTIENAIAVIEANREMGSLLGHSFALKYLSEEKVRFAVAIWEKQHPPRRNGGPESEVLTARQVMARVRSAPSSHVSGRALIAGLTPDELADLNTLFYLSRDRYFAESYDGLLEHTRREYLVLADHISKAAHLMSKTNFLREVCRALRMLGLRRLGDELWEARRDLH